MNCFKTIKSHLLCSVVAATCLLPLSVNAQQFEEIAASAQAYVDDQARQIMSDSLVIDSIKAQNQTHADVSQDEIDSLDKTW